MLPGIPVHIVQRGNNRQACFASEEDRAFYLFHLERALPRAGCSLHAYCLMTNHVHLLLTARLADGCAQLMKYISQLHTQYMNRRYERTGSLWEGRFRSCLVQAEDYLLACYRYVELNPVRAGIAPHASAYRWSSYAANAQDLRTALLTPHEEFLRLGIDEAGRRNAYRELVEEGIDDRWIQQIRSATNGNVALGGEAFRRTMAVMLGRRVEPGKPGRPRNVVCP